MSYRLRFEISIFKIVFNKRYLFIFLLGRSLITSYFHEIIVTKLNAHILLFVFKVKNKLSYFKLGRLLNCPEGSCIIMID